MARIEAAVLASAVPKRKGGQVISASRQRGEMPGYHRKTLL